MGIEIQDYKQEAQKSNIKQADNKVENDELTKLYLFPAIQNSRNA